MKRQDWYVPAYKRERWAQLERQATRLIRNADRRARPPAETVTIITINGGNAVEEVGPNGGLAHHAPEGASIATTMNKTPAANGSRPVAAGKSSHRKRIT
jgi:hypothetical protein